MKRLILICALASGCGATLEQLQSRAAFDLDCPAPQLHVVELDDRTRGVSGCGKKATYVEDCQSRMGMNSPPECTWVANGPAQSPR